jgi:hypothetical protein
MQHLEEPVRGLVLGAFTDALTDLFLVAVPFVVVAFVIALFLREVPLRTKIDVPEGTSPADVLAKETSEPRPADTAPVHSAH